jgi:uncharacterized protein YdhG (YjbR/CyaY superfamily)
MVQGKRDVAAPLGSIEPSATRGSEEHPLMKPKPRSVDHYLSTCTPAQRAALQKLRRTIGVAVPRAVECISYHLPAFRLDGRLFVEFGAAVDHCSLYPCSGALIAAHRAEFAKYDTSKGAIRFKTDQPLPAALVRKVLKWRIAEESARAARRAADGGGTRRRRAR